MGDVQLFDSKARLLPLDVIEPQLTDDGARERFAAVKTAYERSMQTDAELADEEAQVKSLMSQIAETDAAMKKIPKPTFLDACWRPVVKGE